MKMTVHGTQYNVRWDHLYIGTRRTTTCNITNSRGLPAGYGVATCSEKDQFQKAIGRRKSFTKAIAGFSRADRTLFWDAYKAEWPIGKSRSVGVPKKSHSYEARQNALNDIFNKP
jgi:hypothetical protein